MMTTMQAMWTALLLMGAALTARADETPPELLPLQEAEQEEVYGWSGEAPDVDELLGRIAAAGVVARADGDYDRAEEMLDEVWLRATAIKGFPRQTQLLVQIALARAELYRMQGKQEQAVRATEELLIKSADAARFAGYRKNLEAANEALLARAVKAANDPILIQLRAELLDQRESTDHDSLAKIVRNAYANQDFNVIVEIGAPAQPAFADEIVADADTFPPSINADPLIYLLQMNEGRAAEILLANLDAGGYLWKRRIVRAMDVGNVMNNPGTWSSDQPYVCLEPEWLSVLEALLSSPDTALQSVHLITEPFFRDQLTPGIQRAVVRGIEGYDLDFVNAVLQALDHGGVVDSARPIFEAAARHSDPQVRRFAARALVNYESSDTLKAMADDDDPEVRASVVRILGPHGGRFMYRNYRLSNGRPIWSTDTQRRSFHPPVGEAERALLVRFAADPSARVRHGVAEALSSLEKPLEDEVYLRLARDEDPEVRRVLIWITGIGADLRSRILKLLAEDTNEDLISRLDEMLTQAPLGTDPTPYLDALEIRLTDRRYPMDDARWKVVDNLVPTPRGLQAVVAWTLEGDDRALQDLLFERLYAHGFERLLTLDDASLGGVFARSHDYAGGGQSHYYNNARNTIRDARPSRRGAMRLVVGDESYDVAVRLNAAALAAPDGGSAFQEDVLRLLHDDYWKSSVATSDDLDTIYRIVAALPDDEENAFVLRVVRDETIADGTARYAARDYFTSGPLGREVTLAVIERWFAPEGMHVSAVETAIAHLAALPDDADAELLKTAALTPHYAEAAVKTMVALRKEEFLPTLARCMEAEWVTSESRRKRVRYDAAAGISSFLSDEAAEILLRGLASPDKDVRMVCSSGLQHIESTRQRYAMWEEMKLGQPTKESALAELLRMIDDDHQEIRMQAIRGIATFGAIEYLPTLIRLLEDPDGMVVEAAREAIDQLNRTAAARTAAGGD